MHPQIENVFDEAENRYLKTEELAVLSGYVTSLPVRLTVYRLLRDNELAMMQAIADKLVAQLPQEKPELLERSIKNALLTLRYCAMGLLINDERFVQARLEGWLSQSSQVYNSQKIDAALYQLLDQALSRVLNAEQLGLMKPMLSVARTILQIDAPQAAAIAW